MHRLKVQSNLPLFVLWSPGSACATSLMQSRAGRGARGAGEGGSGPNWKGGGGSDTLESEAESGSRRLVRLLLEVAGDKGW